MLAVISWVCGLKLSDFLFSTAVLENGIFLQIFKLFLSANSFFLSSAVQLCSSLAVQRSIGRILCTHLLHIYITRGCRAKKNHQQILDTYLNFVYNFFKKLLGGLLHIPTRGSLWTQWDRERIFVWRKIIINCIAGRLRKLWTP